MQLNHAESPAGGSSSGDDYSGIALDRDYLYAGWADWRPGTRAGYFSAVKLDAFKP